MRDQCSVQTFPSEIGVFARGVRVRKKEREKWWTDRNDDSTAILCTPCYKKYKKKKKSRAARNNSRRVQRATRNFLFPLPSPFLVRKTTTTRRKYFPKNCYSSCRERFIFSPRGFQPDSKLGKRVFRAHSPLR